MFASALLAPSVAFSQPTQDVVPGEYIVRFKSTASTQVQGKIQGKANLKAAFPSKGTFHLSDVDPSLVRDLQSDPDVEYVEPNFRLQSIDGEDPGPPVDAQTAKYYDQTGSTVKATEAWAASSAYSGTNRPIVAIIDSGLDKTHSVFTSTNAVWINPGEIAANGIDDDFNGYIDDVSGWNFITNSPNFADDENHGTHVAGIVLGATQDILTTPLDPAKIRLMPLKFLDSNGSGSTSAAISAMYYAVNMGARVINCSWGGGSYSHALHDAITYAYNHGVLVVTAAGNYTSNNDVSDMYPANYAVPSNMSVAATADTDRLASFSNYGAGMVHIGSPGVAVYSTLPGNWYGSMSGTSMAAPFVAGAAALALREAPQLSGYQMKSVIMSQATPVSYLTGYVSSGARINVLNMVNTAKTMAGTSAYQPVYAPTYLAERSPSSTTTKGGGCGLVSALGTAGAGKTLFDDSSSGDGGGWPPGAPILLVLFGMPALAWFVLRRRVAEDGAAQRRHDRYLMSSDIVIKAGGRELVGTLKTISMGGLSFNVDEALERGGNVTMKVTGPDGKEAIEVEGRIVWSERNESYGVQFESVKTSVKDVMFSWMKGLVRQ